MQELVMGIWEFILQIVQAYKNPLLIYRVRTMSIPIFIVRYHYDLLSEANVLTWAYQLVDLFSN
jgi:hypothetical protein